MLRSKLLLILLSGVLVIASCNDSGTDSDDSENGEDPIEPTASVNNPEDEAVVEGEITFSVDGEAENGFSEARIFVGDEQVESIEDPSLPHDQTVNTYEYDNGDYDLRAELDVAEEDTTIEASVSVSLENYMVTLETDDYIEMLNENNDAAYMFIADPDGNVLREIELTAHSDGTIELLPPSEIEGDAPEQYSVTIGEKTTYYDDRDAFYLNTDIGLESWSTINLEGNLSDDEKPSAREMTVEMSNFEQTPLYTDFYFTDYSFGDLEVHRDGDLSTTIEVPEGYDDLVITHTPDYENVDDPVPVYRWENNLSEMESSQSYNVAEDFSKMVSHPVSVPSDIDVLQYDYYMTIAPDSFEEGDIPFAFWNPRQIGDANGNDSGLGMWVPEIDERSFITYMYGNDKSNSDISHRFQTSVMDGFPDEFVTVEAGVQLNNRSLDDLQVDISGTFDYARIYASHSTDSYNHSWSVALPDSATSFSFPQIADSLDESVNNYSRSDFEFTSVNMYDYGKYEGYGDYLENSYGTTDFGNIIEWAYKIKSLSTEESKEVEPTMKKQKEGVIDMRNESKVINSKRDELK
ncbi:MAG: hypothetical protein ACQEST_10345 [Bacteroidota bacterium]